MSVIGRPRNEAIAALLLVLLVVTVTLWTSLAGSYVWDDHHIIEGRSSLSRSLPEIFTLPWWPDGANMGLWRPLSLFSIAVEQRFGGVGPAVHHRGNLLLHLGCVAVLFFLCLRLFPGRPWCAAVASLLFGVHPVVAEPVTSVVGRADLLCTLCTLGAVLAGVSYFQSGKSKGLVGALLLCSGASLSKEIGAVAPLLVLLFSWHEGASRKRRGLFFAWAAILGFVWLGLRYWVLGRLSPDSSRTVFPGISHGLRVLTGFTVLRRYLEWTLWPRSLPPILPVSYVPPADSVVAASVLLSLLAIGGLVGVIVWLRSRNPVAAAGLGWYLLALVPVSHILVPVGVTVASRCLHLPLAGMALFVTAVAFRWRARIPRGILLLVIVAVCCVQTRATSVMWTSDLALWTGAAECFGENSPIEVLVPLGSALLDHGDFNEALQHFRLAEAKDPSFEHLQVNMARCEVGVGRVELAKERLGRAFFNYRAGDKAAGNLAFLYHKEGKLEQAELWYSRIEHDTTSLANFALLYMQTGRPIEARRLALRVLAREPNQQTARNEIAGSSK